MPAAHQTFKRTEKKYRINQHQYRKIIPVIREHIEEDPFRKATIFSLYFDTPDNLLIRRSIDKTDKPVYKEKLRLRTYGVPENDSMAFVEIKKKFKKIVYKRRAVMKFEDAWKLLIEGEAPEGYEKQQQIINEILWFMKVYNSPAPSLLVSYDRIAFSEPGKKGLRVTFDNNILWRNDRLSPSYGAGGYPVIGEDEMIMEIKIPGAMPLWLSSALSEAEIYPVSFSKVGTAYRQKLGKGEDNND